MVLSGSPDHITRPVVGVYAAQPAALVPIIGELVPDSHVRVCAEWDGLGDIVADLDVLLAFKFGFRPFPRERILAAPRLRWVQLASAGADHLAPYDPERLVVTNASGIHGDIMSQYVIGMLLHVTWQTTRLVDQQRARRWQRYDVSSIRGRTMCIVGAGRVGSAIAARARVFGMNVIGVRRSGAPLDGFDRMYDPGGLAAALAESDVVVLTLPLTADTRHSIGMKELSALRPTAWLINVSRGGIVDEPALLDVLRRGAIAGAVLDVFAEEPLPEDSEFWSVPNVVVTPHISSEFAGWPGEVARLFCANLRRWIDREPLQNVVDPVSGY